LAKTVLISCVAGEGDEGGGGKGPASRIPARVVLGFLSFGGFLTNYMLRVNLNIAIVSMTASADAALGNAPLAECKINASDSHLLPHQQQVKYIPAHCLIKMR